MLYALVGRNRHLSVGADSTIAPVLATGVAAIAAVGTSGYTMAMALTAVLVGGLLIVIGLLRLGRISEFLSTPVITGVLAGIAVEIIVRQLPVILGVPGGGNSTTIGLTGQVIAHIHQINGWSAGIALGVLVVIVASQHINPRIPGPLIGLILSIVAVDALGLGSHQGVALLGTVQGGLPHVQLPSASWSELGGLAGSVLTVTFLCIAQTAATARESSDRDAKLGDFNRDLIGVGAGSVVAGFIGVLAVDASPPNTAIVAASGARSQLTNVTAALAVLAVVLVATAPLAELPQATLGATLIFVATKLFRIGQLRAVFRFDRLEFTLAGVTLLAVALVGIEQGVLLAMFLSLANRTRRTARPRDTILGREPNTDHWVPIDIGRPTEQLPGVLVYLVYAPLWYGNADYVRLRIRHLIDAASDPVRTVILDANGISDIDYTGMQVLRELTTELKQRRVTIGIARTSHLVHHDLKHGALLQQIGRDHLFASVEEAVIALRRP